MTSTTRSKAKPRTPADPKPAPTARARRPAKPKPKAKPDPRAPRRSQTKSQARQADFDARVAEWDSRIKEVEARYQRARANVGSEVGDLLDGLRESRKDVSAQIDRMKQAGDDALDRSRTAVETAFNEVAAAYEAIRRRLT